MHGSEWRDSAAISTIIISSTRRLLFGTTRLLLEHVPISCKLGESTNAPVDDLR